MDRFGCLAERLAKCCSTERFTPLELSANCLSDYHSAVVGRSDRNCWYPSRYYGSTTTDTPEDSSPMGREERGLHLTRSSSFFLFTNHAHCESSKVFEANKQDA